MKPAGSWSWMSCVLGWSSRLQRRGRVLYLLIAVVLSSCTSLFLVLDSSSTRHLPSMSSLRFQSRRLWDPIPNKVHYIWALKQPDGDLNFTFEQYVSVYSAQYYWKPEAIYLHTEASEAAIARARAGAVSKWSALMLAMPGFRVNRVEMVRATNTGKSLNYIEHISDFARVPAVHRYGGIYLDFDVLPIRDITPLRQSGFNAVTGIQPAERVTNSGIFMAKKGSKLTGMWMDMIHQVYDGGWVTHSNSAIDAVANTLVAQPGEMLKLDSQAFIPVGWTLEDANTLFGLQPGTEPLAPGQPLPPPDPDNDPCAGWAMNFSASYMIHTFTPDWDDTAVQVKVPNMTEITPAYVLARRSNYGCAAYPVVRDMYEKGLVTLDD